MKWQAAIIALLYAGILQAGAEPIHCDPEKTYPIPANDNQRMLFYIQRSLNSNTVVYEVNLTQEGFISEDDPVSIYWRRYATNGEIRNLKWFEISFAYGVESKKNGNGEFQIYFPSYEQRRARLYLSRAKKAELEVSISGRVAIAYCAYVQLRDNEALYPQVLHVDLYGRDSTTGEVLVERLTNREQSGRDIAGKR